MANILDNLGQVIVASVVIPTLFGTPLDGADPKMVALVGIMVTVLIWLISLRLEGVPS